MLVAIIVFVRKRQFHLGDAARPVERVKIEGRNSLLARYVVAPPGFGATDTNWTDCVHEYRKAPNATVVARLIMRALKAIG